MDNKEEGFFMLTLKDGTPVGRPVQNRVNPRYADAKPAEKAPFTTSTSSQPQARPSSGETQAQKTEKQINRNSYMIGELIHMPTRSAKQ
jgi:hypothetical protein